MKITQQWAWGMLGLLVTVHVALAHPRLMPIPPTPASEAGEAVENPLPSPAAGPGDPQREVATPTVKVAGVVLGQALRDVPRCASGEDDRSSQVCYTLDFHGQALHAMSFSVAMVMLDHVPHPWKTPTAVDQGNVYQEGNNVVFDHERPDDHALAMVVDGRIMGVVLSFPRDSAWEGVHDVIKSLPPMVSDRSENLLFGDRFALGWGSWGDRVKLEIIDRQLPLVWQDDWRQAMMEATPTSSSKVFRPVADESVKGWSF